MQKTIINDIASLLDAERRGERIDYLFFWGHKASPDGRTTKQCFSQWWPARFTVDGTLYKTAEHFMMAGKARLFGDRETLARILTAPDPGSAKRLGRMVRGFDEERWNEERSEIVVRANVEKFGQNPPLREFLLNTGERVLVEASPMDRIWGIGMAESDPRARFPNQWQGLNLLGFALMEARTILRGATDEGR
jgi:ribA/ribD-fused uncharacterized protein